MKHDSLQVPDERDAPGAPRLHFAMLTCNALAATRRAVRSLAATTEAPFALHVVDNASTDGTREWLAAQREPWLFHRLNAENRGVPGGRNDLLDLVLPAARARDWIVFVDNDLEFHPGWLAPFVAAMQQHPNARVLGKVGHLVTVRGERRELLPAPVETGHVDVVSGGFACFVRVDAARAIGAFDEGLGRFWHEDDDWCVRALQCGFDVVAVPEAEITHHEHGSGVALPDLADGGSRRNLRYLADKWRRAGWIDRDGWIRRASPGPYLPPEVRDHLARALPRQRPPGRLELAQAIALLEQLLATPDPASWFDRNRRPVPACFWPLLALHRAQAEQLGEAELAKALAALEAPLRERTNTARLQPVGCAPPVDEDAGTDAGQGVCREQDFDDPALLRVADELGVGALARDPGARTASLWQMLAVAAALERTGRCRPGARIRLVGDCPERVPGWLARRGAVVVDDHDAARDHAPCDALVCAGPLALERLQQELAEHTTRDTVVVLTGDVVWNGVPTPTTPQPHQLELDVLERARLSPLGPLALTPDRGALEACALSPDDARAPQLCRLQGPQVVSAYCVACRPAAARAATRPANPPVLAPARPAAATTLRVGVDLRTLQQADSASRGIGKYTSQHLAALCDAEPGLHVTGYVLDANARLPKLLERPQLTPCQIDAFDPAAVDLVHLPDPMNMSFGFDSPMRALRHARTTVTFHDLTPLHLYVDEWPERNRAAYLDRLRQLERGEQRLLCNSRFTADDLIAHTTIAPERVTPILAGLHHDGGAPPTPDAVAAVHRQLGIRGPFVLHVGALDPHKNFYAALSAFLMARAAAPLQLVVVGAVDVGTSRAAALCRQKDVPDVRFTGYLPRAHLDALYASATALLFLSRAEGFGLPILEAMAKGCPVIASGVTSHPEVAGDAALLVDPDDQQAAAAHVRRLLGDPAFADELRDRGRRQAQRFPWRAVAERTLTVWRELREVRQSVPGTVRRTSSRAAATSSARGGSW